MLSKQRDNVPKSAEENDMHRLDLAAFEFKCSTFLQGFHYSGLFEGKKLA